MTKYMGAFQGVAVENDGPDGLYLHLDTEEGQISVQIGIEDAPLFVEALKPCLDSLAEMEQVAGEYLAMKRTSAQTRREWAALHAGEDVLAFEPREVGYDESDPKHPDFVETMADFGDAA